MTRGVPVRVSRARLAAMRADPNVTRHDIAAVLGVHPSYVATVAANLGLPKIPKDKPRIDRDALARMWLAGVPSRQIARELQGSPQYIRGLAKQLGLPSRAVRRGGVE